MRHRTLLIITCACTYRMSVAFMIVGAVAMAASGLCVEAVSLQTANAIVKRHSENRNRAAKEAFGRNWKVGEVEKLEKVFTSLGEKKFLKNPVDSDAGLHDLAFLKEHVQGTRDMSEEEKEALAGTILTVEENASVPPAAKKALGKWRDLLE